MKKKKLRNEQHPNDFETGNYFAPGTVECHTVFGSWIEFVEASESYPPGLNHLIRWDWTPADAGGDGLDRLMLFWVANEKAYLYSHEVRVWVVDEPEIRAWLADRAAEVAAIWSPFLRQVRS